MHTASFHFDYEIYDSELSLTESDRRVFSEAKKATSLSYAPYSRFYVGAAALLENGEIIKGGNQENASFPAGLCAEGTVLASAAIQFPGMAIAVLALSFRSDIVASDHPVSPCGVCRQSLQEFQERTGSAIRLIMGGFEGQIYVVREASSLLPLSFKF